MPMSTDQKSPRKACCPQPRAQENGPWHDRGRLSNHHSTPAKQTVIHSHTCHQGLSGEPGFHPHRPQVRGCPTPLLGWYQRWPSREPGLSSEQACNEASLQVLLEPTGNRDSHPGPQSRGGPLGVSRGRVEGLDFYLHGIVGTPFPCQVVSKRTS